MAKSPLLDQSQMSKYVSTRRRLICVIAAEYALLLCVALVVASSVYLIVQLNSPISVAFNVSSLSAVSLNILVVVRKAHPELIQACLSAISLVIHQIAAYRYFRHDRYEVFQRSSFMVFLRDSTIFLSIFVWAAASAFGLAIASNSPFCAQERLDSAHWGRRSLLNCQLQKAQTAVDLFTMCVEVLKLWSLGLQNTD